MAFDPNGVGVNSQGWRLWEPLEQGHPPCLAPTGRPESVPDIALVPRQVMLAQQRPKLVLERQRLVVARLIGDVALHGIDVRRGHRERAVAGLPGEAAIVGK